MEDPGLRCWRCGEALSALSLPLSRLDECPACTMPLHVCRMCLFYDPTLPRQCREDDADDVKEKERANFCDYFRPSPRAFDPSGIDAEAKARRRLGSLFGDGEDAEAAADDILSEAESLFRDD